MASEVGICNRALQHLGARRITSLTQDTPNARECNAVYETVRDRELRRHRWAFAIERTSLPALSTAPAHGFSRQFQLPTDCLRVLREANVDWSIEGSKILTDDTAPLDVRYIRQVTDPNAMDVLFREALSAAIAFDLCERITQSNTKKRDLSTIYSDLLAEARRINGIERPAQDVETDDWVLARL